MGLSKTGSRREPAQRELSNQLQSHVGFICFLSADLGNNSSAEEFGSIASAVCLRYETGASLRGFRECCDTNAYP
jgi:hypothetical protein